MSLEPFTALAGLVTLLEAVLGAVLVVDVARAWVARRGGAPPVGADPVTLLAAPASVLVVLSVIAWPLLYLLLQSQVPRWAGVMCIEGVLRVGTGSEGAAGWLPGLARGLQFTKPAVLFAAGAWLVLHRLDRGTRTAPLARRVLGALAVLGMLALADAALEATWLAIPKREQALATGCCTFHTPTTSLGVVARMTAGLTEAERDAALVVATFTVAGILIAGTLVLRQLLAGGRALPVWLALALVPVAVLWVPLSLDFASHVAAPRLVALPDHHCVYCLLAEVPLGGAAIGLSMLGTFGVGWTATLLVWGRHDETLGTLRPLARGSLMAALVGFAGVALLAALARAVG
jgi:hypothetical protein